MVVDLSKLGPEPEPFPGQIAAGERFLRAREMGGGLREAWESLGISTYDELVRYLSPPLIAKLGEEKAGGIVGITVAAMMTAVEAQIEIEHPKEEEDEQSD